MQVLLQFMEKSSGNLDWYSSGTVQENQEQFQNTGTCFRRGSTGKLQSSGPGWFFLRSCHNAWYFTNGTL